MTRRTVVAIVVVFLAWSVLDLIIHGVLLKSAYEATAGLWRPMDEMNMPLMNFVTLVFTGCFVLIYGALVGEKSLRSGIKYGFLFGLATGISMGFGAYSCMPIPLSLAWSWFIGAWIECITAGALVGAIMKY